MPKKIGRNDPCPCGSGKKYKKCCLAGSGPAPGYTERDRQSALYKLNRFADSRQWRDVEEQAGELFWGPYFDAYAKLEDEGLNRIAENVFDYWFYFDHRIRDDSTLAERLLDSGWELSPGERAYIRQALGTSVRLYEVIDVRPGASIRLRDLIEGSEVTITEHSASRQVHRWDLLGARIFPLGTTGTPVIDGDCFPLPRAIREQLMEQLEDLRQDFPAGEEAAFYRMLSPYLCCAWLHPVLAPQPPRLQTTDGHELVFSKAYFDILDAEKLTAALNSAKDLERDQDEKAWMWHGRGKSKDQVILLGALRVEGERLVLETASAERAAKGRALVEKKAGGAVRYRLTSRQDPGQALAAAENGFPEASEPPPEEIFQAVSEQYERHYRGWLDEEIPALDGHTPRRAAAMPALRPRLVEMLKDLENLYQKALGSGQPGFDPSWMWAELGIADHPEAPGGYEHAPLTGYESMEPQVPGIGAVARAIADRFRQKPGFDAATVISRQELAEDPDFERFIEKQAVDFQRRHRAEKMAVDHANLIASHLEYMSNFELHRRKTFWVDESLAWMLGQTRLEINGDILRPPFACFALIFTDRDTLRTAERMLSADLDCELRGAMLKVATAYVTETSVGADMGLRVAFTFDALAGQWPYLVARDLLVRADARLEEILDSHLPDVDAEKLDPMFSSAPLGSLLHMVFNAILYASSAGVEPEVRRPAPGAGKKGRAAAGRVPFSSDEVFFLPGKIDIRSVRRMQEVERAPSGRKLMNRFMVRGHWRRPAANWKEQRPRWIKPHWKGPEMASVIERAYRLKQ